MVFSYVFVSLEVEMPVNLWNNTGFKCLIFVFNSKPNDNHLFASSFGNLLDHKIPKCGWKTVAVYLSVIFPDTDGLATTSLVWPVHLLIGKISLSPVDEQLSPRMTVWQGFAYFPHLHSNDYRAQVTCFKWQRLHGQWMPKWGLKWMLAIHQLTTNQSDWIYSSHPILLRETGLMKHNNLLHTETGSIHQASETTPSYFFLPNNWSFSWKLSRFVWTSLCASPACKLMVALI